jgi:regulator of RNase E activity RraB
MPDHNHESGHEPSHEPSWMGHGFETDEGPCSCMIDIGLQSVCPDAHRPICTLVRVPFHEPGENGFGDAEERDRLGEIEDDVEERIFKHGGIHFATVRGAGRLDIWYYSGAATADFIGRAAEQAFSDYEIEFGSNEDTEWQQYQMLFPDSEAIASFMDARLIEALMQAGDNLEKPRVVNHFIIAPSEPIGRTIAQAAGKQRFKLEGLEQSESEAGADDPDQTDEVAETWVLHLSRTDPVDPDSVAELREMLMSLADEHGGVYDGWQCPVTK